MAKKQTVSDLQKQIRDLAFRNNDLGAKIEKLINENEELKIEIGHQDVQIRGLNTTTSIYLTKRTELEAQVRILKELIKELFKNK